MNFHTRDKSTPKPIVRPVAWMHEHPERFDVIHNEAKELWLGARPSQVEHYTIPLWLHERREPLSTDAACALILEVLGSLAMQDGNLIKLLRAIERAHGISASNATVRTDHD